jgi:ketosteroid isomerase-like protein
MRTLHYFRWFIVLLLALVPAVSRAQSPDQLYTATPLQLAVTKALLAQAKAWNQANMDAYLSFYKDAPDTIAVLASPVHGTQNIHNAYYVNFPRAEAMGTLDESEVEVRALGDNFALATGHYHLTRNKKGGGDADGSFMDIFEKTSAGWKIIYSETT